MLFERTPKPLRDRDPESLFGSVEDAVGEQPPQRALEEELRAQAAQLHVQGEARGEPDEVVVEERDAALERGHHARPVELDQDVVLEVQAHVHQQDLVERVGRHGDVEL